MNFTRFVSVCVCLSALLAFSPAARADGDIGYHPNANWPDTQVKAHVDSRPDGVYVQISVRQTVPGSADNSTNAVAPNSGHQATDAASANQPATDTNESSDSQSWSDNTGYHNVAPDGTRTDLTPPLIGQASADMWRQDMQAHPGSLPWVVEVNGQFQDIIWIPTVPEPIIINKPQPIDNTLPSGNGGSHDPRQVALDILAHIPLPDIKLKMNPGLGLVALSSWYWVSGYNGSDISQSRTVTIPAPNPLQPPTSFTVSVRIWPTRYTWDFGDGTSIDSHSLGEPYPAQSDVQHTYEFSSHGHQGGFPVRLTVEFAAEYRVNGGGAQGLPAIRHTYETEYPVQELQPVLTRK